VVIDIEILHIASIVHVRSNGMGKAYVPNSGITSE